MGEGEGAGGVGWWMHRSLPRLLLDAQPQFAACRGGGPLVATGIGALHRNVIGRYDICQPRLEASVFCESPLHAPASGASREAGTCHVANVVLSMAVDNGLCSTRAKESDGESHSASVAPYRARPEDGK